MKRQALSWRVRGLVMADAWYREAGAFLCHWCLSRLSQDEVVIDHWMPLALGGSNEPENLVVACQRCNAMKGAKHPEEAEALINAFLDGECA